MQNTNTSVSRSTFQKVCEENKRLLADIKILTAEGISPHRILLIQKWQEKFKNDKELNDLIGYAVREYLKEHPGYDLSLNIPAKTDSNPKAFK